MADPQIDFFGILKHEELCPMFEEWLKKDMSYENYCFWRAVEEFKQSNPEDVDKNAKELYEKYFALGSDWEVNADHYQKLELKENIKNPTLEVFDDIQISIFVLMRMDSYRKFTESDEFLDWQERTLGIKREREEDEGEGVMEEKEEPLAKKNTHWYSCIVCG